jgi:uncharacterized protein YjbI with pentapeptide repeats
VEFVGTTFNDGQFDRARFGHAMFDNTRFTNNASFRNVTFGQNASFFESTFLERASFYGAMFGDEAIFGSTTFRDVWFSEATFGGAAQFPEATFGGYARFKGACFNGRVFFAGCSFKSIADFTEADFGDARVWCSAHKKQRRQTGIVDFDGVIFENDVVFKDAIFPIRASFAKVNFERNAMFNGAQFDREADFGAILARRAFSFAGANFTMMPDFIQAHFEEAPRLDNALFRRQIVQPQDQKKSLVSPIKWLRFRGDANHPARWRALKRLAIQGHDHPRELEFQSMEIRSARFVTDWPLPFGKSASWSGFLRFWFGLIYQLTSDFGRSVARPVIGWGLMLVIAAALYLAESNEAARRFVAAATVQAELEKPAPAAADRGNLFTALFIKGVPCVTGQGKKIISLPDEVAGQTNAATEALHLALSNGFVIGDVGGGDDGARRTYGCLYGLEQDASGNTYPLVPGRVALVSKLQKVISALFIFLFGLAIRNMLRLK